MPKNCTGFQKYFFNMTNSLCVPSFFLSYRATAKPGLSFSTARTSDSTLWDISVNPDRESSPNSVSVVCHRKVATTAKRSVFHMYRTWTETWRPWLVNLIWKKKNAPKKKKKKNISIFLGPQTLTILSTPKKLVIFILYLVFSQIWFMSAAATWNHDPLTWTSKFWHLWHTFFSEENIVMQSLGWGVRSWIIHVYEESQ